MNTSLIERKTPDPLLCKPDNELVRAAQDGDGFAYRELFHRYLPLIKKKANQYFLAGADKDDILQEGLIGLHKAVRDYRLEAYRQFCSFAELCVKRQMITAVKSASRQKHQPLNRYLSLENDSEFSQPSFSLPDEQIINNLEDMIVGQELIDEMMEFLYDKLSDFEINVLKSRVNDLPYKDICNQLQCKAKSVDNALQRIKKKIKEYDLKNENTLTF